MTYSSCDKLLETWGWTNLDRVGTFIGNSTCSFHCFVLHPVMVGLMDKLFAFTSIALREHPQASVQTHVGHPGLTMAGLPGNCIVTVAALDTKTLPGKMDSSPKFRFLASRWKSQCLCISPASCLYTARRRDLWKTSLTTVDN